MTRADEIATEFETRNPGRDPVAASDPAAVHQVPAEANGHQHGPLHLNAHIHLPHHQAVDAPGSVPDAEAAHAVEVLAPEPDPAADEPSGAPVAEDRADPEVSAGDTDGGRIADEPTPAGPQSTKPVHAPQHETLPHIARAAAGGILQAAGWTAGTSLRVSNQLRRLAVDPSSAQEVIDEVTREVREVARDFLGITELDAEVQQIAPLLSSGLLKAGGASPAALRAQGEELLRAAADVGFEEGAHPAFARILAELSPDEARILRVLAIEGPQPLVDVRASNLIGNGSQLIAQSLNMLGPKSGLRQRERVPVYLTNLVRLSLVLLSDEPLDSPVEYQVLEAQPEVIAKLRDTVRAKTIRRSITLTPLGQEFCEVCLPSPLTALPPPRDSD